MASFLSFSTTSPLKGPESQALSNCLSILPQFPLCKMGGLMEADFPHLKRHGASGLIESMVLSILLPWRVRRPVLLANLPPKCLFPFSRTPWEAGLMPHRPLSENLASSTYGTVSFGRRKSSTLPTAPRTCLGTSSRGWTTTLMCLEGLPSGLWRPVRSASWICSYLLPVQEVTMGLF